MKKRDKLCTKTGLEIECNIIGFMNGIFGNEIIIYTIVNNEKELLASYYNLNNEKIILSDISDEKEWEYIEKTFYDLHNKLKK